MSDEVSRSSLNLDYYGIIATLADEIGIAQTIDEMVDNHFNQTVTTGQSVKAILHNMLAIFMRPLYLTSEFLNDKPVDRLVHPDLTADHFTDNVLGAALDRLYETGLDEIFLRISSRVFINYPELVSPFLHADITQMIVHGDYETEDHENAIEMAHGWPNINHDDVKQFLIAMVTCERLPVFLTTLSGNTSHKTYFREMVAEYGKQMQEAFESNRTFVFDSEFYNKPSIQACGATTKWISRVKESYKEAKSLLHSVDEDQFKETDLDGYKIYGVDSNWGGIQQRWVLVESEKAYKRERRSLGDAISAEHERVEKDIWHLGNQEFESKKCACREAKKVVEQWKFHSVKEDLDDPKSMEFDITRKKKQGGRGRPRKDEDMDIFYHIKLDPVRSEEQIKQSFHAKGKFIVATNDLELEDVEILKGYKKQHNVERGFRFLKDPMFFVDSFWLKNQSRIMAMAMIMGLALLIYSLAEKKLRAAFIAHDEVFLDRYREQIKTPTIRRVLQTWSGIHVWYIKSDGELIEEAVVNLRPENKQVLRLLGPQYQNIYSDNPNYHYNPKSDGDQMGDEEKQV